MKHTLNNQAKEYTEISSTLPILKIKTFIKSKSKPIVLIRRVNSALLQKSQTYLLIRILRI